jgi:hypothetical protein
LLREPAEPLATMLTRFWMTVLTFTELAELELIRAMKAFMLRFLMQCGILWIRIVVLEAVRTAA